MWKNIKKINHDMCILIKNFLYRKFCNTPALPSKREELSRGVQNSRNEKKSKKYLWSLTLQHVFTEFL